jgi:hypothetical protein
MLRAVDPRVAWEVIPNAEAVEKRAAVDKRENFILTFIYLSVMVEFLSS